mmetsp:Transcript_40215/g.99390  ORF Transcript_40215/g.99390 Transcript_40215/m.99390 type:complete len:210 (-) Transcript_40215:199-828(-)
MHASSPKPRSHAPTKPATKLSPAPRVERTFTGCAAKRKKRTPPGKTALDAPSREASSTPAAPRVTRSVRGPWARSSVAAASSARSCASETAVGTGSRFWPVCPSARAIARSSSSLGETNVHPLNTPARTAASALGTDTGSKKKGTPSELHASARVLRPSGGRLASATTMGADARCGKTHARTQLPSIRPQMDMSATAASKSPSDRCSAM